MKKILLIALYDYPYGATASIITPEVSGFRELKNAHREDFEFAAYGADNAAAIRLNAIRLLDRLGEKDVDGLLIVEDGGVNFYGAL